MNRDRLLATLRVEEGTHRFPSGRHQLYVDTKGKWTIGYGRNLTDTGISDDEADYLLGNDVTAAVQQVTDAFPWFAALDDVRQRVIVDLAFNMGLGDSHQGLLSFHRMLAHAAMGEWDQAADELQQSQWDHDVASRAPALIAMLRTGEEPS